ncbi:ABC transporter substrate-binding protein [Natronosalvus rutilus]|uniref:ABC transporter substrate-binding protein n=1 Tax=Natronosalvus rutilus TaxID=2953753 RepID=A0A9E7N9G3_9EURY|nr:ABC transporter substrate-binding protein [Natronosalvus rutilus]UTF52939.1 ABC transporter substrate-binding protein [Natronosalvus rutilus]
MPNDNGVSRRSFLKATSAGAATAAVAGCFGGDEGNGDGNGDGNGNGNESGNGNGNGNGDGDLSNVEKAQQAWERAQDNPAPEDEETRMEAYLEMEEAIRDDMILLPLYHGLTERFWYDTVEVEPTGSLGSHRQQHNETTTEDGTLNLINSGVSSLDPIQSTDTASGVIINQVYENLVHYPNGVPEVENQLVEEVNVSDDLLTYTFTIKEAQFHDGSELTASDFVYAWRRLAESTASERANFLVEPGFLAVEHETEGEGEEATIVPDSLGVEAVDDRTIEMRITEPQPSTLDILTYDSFAAMPEGLVGDIEGYDGEYSQEQISQEVMVGCGPFQFDMWEGGTEVQVTAFDNYHGSGPELDAIHWQIIEDDEAIRTYYNERNADIFGIPTPFYDQDKIEAEEDDMGRQIGTYGELENGDTVNYLGVSEMSTFYFAFNARYADKAVRQAIAYVTDHEELINQVFAGRGVEAFSFTPPGIFPGGNEAYQTFVEEWPYTPNETDREGAQQVLEEAGFTPDEPAELTLTTYESEVFNEAATITRDKVADLGIELELEQSEFNTLISRGEDGELQFYSLGWIWSYPSIAYGLFGFEPENTNTEKIPEDADGYYLDWQVEMESEE